VINHALRLWPRGTKIRQIYQRDQWNQRDQRGNVTHRDTSQDVI
jgi:hypothetical protein